MPKSKIPSPARSQGAKQTPRRNRSRRSNSVNLPAPSNTSTSTGRLTALIKFNENNMDSLVLSPMNSRLSVLTDNTEVEDPRRNSWWKKLDDDENPRDVLEVLEHNEAVETQNHNILDELELEVLSQENNYTLEFADSSESESICSIVLPPHKLFGQKENVPQNGKKFDQLVITRESMSKDNEINDKTLKADTKTFFGHGTKRSRPKFPANLLNISNKTISDNEINDKTLKAYPKNIFGHGSKRSRPIFPASLLNISNKTIGDKTKDMQEVPGNQVRKLFRNTPATKRKIMVDDFIVAETEVEIPEIEPRVFAFQRKIETCASTSSRGKRQSNTPNVTTEIEMDEWKMLPSSTMVEHQLEEMYFGLTPLKKARLSKLSKTQGSRIGNMDVDAEPRHVLHKSSDKLRRPSNFEDINNKGNKHESNINQEHIHEADDEVDDDENNYTLTYEDDDYKLTGSEENKNAEDKETNVKDLENDKTLTRETAANGKEINDPNEMVTSNVKDKPAENEEGIKADNQLEGNLEANVYNEIKDEQRAHTKQDNNQNKSQIEEEKSEHKEKNKSIDQNVEDDNENEQNDERKESHQNEIDNDQQNDEQSKQNVQEEVEIDQQDENEQNISEVELQNDSEVEAEQNESQVEASNDQNESEIEEQNDSEDENEVEQNISQVEASSQQNDSEEEQQNDSEDEVEHNECDVEASNDQNESEVEQQDDSEDEQNESQVEASNDQNESEIEEQNDSEDENEVEQNISQVEASNQQNDSEEGQQNDSEDEQNESQVEASSDQNDSDIEEQNDSEDENKVEQNISQFEASNQQNESEDEQQNNSEDEEENDSDKEESEEQEMEVDNIDNVEENENYSGNEEEDQVIQNDSVELNLKRQAIVETEEIAETPNKSHDTTGRKRHKNKTLYKTPEALLDTQPQTEDSYTAHGVNTSKSMKNLSISRILATNRDNIGISDGTKDSSNEGSGWDSHRTTRKTIRQTFGKDNTTRKSLRTLVMERSAQVQTEYNEKLANVANEPRPNSREFHDTENVAEQLETLEESNHEASRILRQKTLEIYLQEVKKRNMEQRIKIKEIVDKKLASIEAIPSRDMFKVPPRLIPRKPTKPKSKPQTNQRKVNLPAEILEDMKYKPPKRFRPRNASWLTKRLYNFLETKLAARYDYKARVRAEKLAETIYNFTKETRKHLNVAPTDLVVALKHEMARLDIVRTHFDFYEFFRDFMPREIKTKVVPDLINKIPLPPHGVFSDIL